MSRSLPMKFGSLESLNCCTLCGWRPCARQMRWTELALTPTALAISAAVQWIVSGGGSVWVSVTTRSATPAPSGGMREGSRLVVQEAVVGFLHEALLPAPDTGLRFAGLPHDRNGA